MLANVVSLAADLNLADDAIIAGVLSGRTEDYEILVRRYNQLLYRTARGILKKEDDIEDAMQEAYLKAFEKLHQFKHEAKFSTWLTRILINCALQQANRIKRDPQPLDEIENELDALICEEESAKPNPQIAENLRTAVEKAIDHLPSKYRLVFVLREIEHTSVLGVATALEITEENVKIRLHRAKAMLRDILQSELQSLEVFEFHAVRCMLMASRVMTEILRRPAFLRPMT